jgi:hypothetical protein
MPKKTRAVARLAADMPGQPDDQPAKVIKRKRNGTFAPGYSASIGTDAARARRALNAATIQEMHRAFERGGRQAIDKVMRTQPAIFLKMLVLLVPRELEVTHSGGVKGLSDEQIEGAIETIKGMLARRAGDDAKLIDADVPSASEQDESST